MYGGKKMSIINAIVNEDLRMVEEAKAGNEAALLTLFLQYQFLIRKKYRSFKRRIGNIPYSLEDFKQDSFIALVKSIDYIKKEKIRDSKWILLGVFVWYLDMMCNNLYKDLKRFYAGSELKSNPTEKDSEGFITSDSFLIEKLVQDSITKEFMESLSPREKDFLKERLKLRQNGKGNPFANIAKKLHVSISTIALINKSVEKKFEFFKQKFSS